FIKPLDEQMLSTIAGSRLPVLTVEEGVRAGGFGSAVMEFYTERHLETGQVRILGIGDRFVEHGSIREQRQLVGLTVQDIVMQARYAFAAGQTKRKWMRSGNE